MFIPGFSVGLSLLNIGKNFEAFDKTKEKLPLRVLLGSTHRLNEIPLSFHFLLTHKNIDKVFSDRSGSGFSFDCEFSITEKGFVRIGFDKNRNDDLSGTSNYNLAGLTFGFGLNFDHLACNYSYSDYGMLGLSHRLGFTFYLDKKKNTEDDNGEN